MTLHRYVIVAEHPRHEGVTSFDLREPTRERAMRRAIVGALQYFRDDDFSTVGPLEVPLAATDSDVDHAVEQLCAKSSSFTREEAFGRE